MRHILTVGAMAVVMGGAVLAQTATVYKPGNGVTLPSVIKEVKPAYTDGAIQRRVQGTVLVTCVVLADGTAGDLAIAKSLDSELDQQAMAAVKEWRFKPGTKDGRPVPVEVTLELSFHLQDGPPVYQIGNGVTSPVLIKEVKPEYPESAKQSGIRGAVELEGVVEVDGSISNIRVTKHLDDRLDQSAIVALAQWRFKPGRKNGEAVRVQVNVELTFSLR